MRNLSAERFFTMVLLIGAAAGCLDRSGIIADGEREAIVREVQRTLDEYKNAILRKDLDAMQGFWSDAKEFVFAGDGAILGGREKWSERLMQYDRETEKWDYFQYRNIHVGVLARDAASATVEFEWSKRLKDGKTENCKGSWTYVFKKYDDRWRVVQSNGTHIAF